MTTVSFDPTTIFTDIDEALTAANTVLPTLIPIIGTFYPPAAALAPFLPLMSIVLQDVQLLQQQLGINTQQATATVAQHVTPGQPNAAALGPSTPVTPAN